MVMGKGGDGKWLVYCMIAKDCSKWAYFKVGISQNLSIRIKAIQSGCPLPVVEVIYIPAFTYKNAIHFERYLHKEFLEYRSSGEWFKFSLGNADHKKKFNAAIQSLSTPLLGEDGKWRRHKTAEFIRRGSAVRLARTRLREMLNTPVLTE